MGTLHGGDGHNYSSTSLYGADQQQQYDNIYKTQIRNQSTQKNKTGGSSNIMQPPSSNKVTAYKLPLAEGKGDLLPALERDLQEPGLSFKNLSRLFKDR